MSSTDDFLATLDDARLFVISDAAISGALTKAFAYKMCDDVNAAAWARELVALLECGEILAAPVEG